MLTRKGPSHLGPKNLMANSTPTTIKKYANRRLYNTASSAYVTLADLAKMVKGGEDFVVYDAKSNEDITRSVLTQIIFEQEGIEGQSLLPTTFLRLLIRFYGGRHGRRRSRGSVRRNSRPQGSVLNGTFDAEARFETPI